MKEQDPIAKDISQEHPDIDPTEVQIFVAYYYEAYDKAKTGDEIIKVLYHMHTNIKEYLKERYVRSINKTAAEKMVAAFEELVTRIGTEEEDTRSTSKNIEQICNEAEAKVELPPYFEKWAYAFFFACYDSLNMPIQADC